jgi:large subunit ribosomal protein L11
MKWLTIGLMNFGRMKVPKIKLIVEGGKMQAGPAVAQQLGPMGINMGKVISDVNEATASFKGVKVPVELDVDAKTKSYEIVVFSPPVAELIKKELKLEKGSGEAGKTQIGNIAIESVIGIAKQKMDGLLARDLKAAVKMVVGTCVSLGVLIDSKNGKEIMSDISEGKYDSEISSGKTEVSDEKIKKLAADFKGVSAEQEKVAKEAAEADAAAEAAKVEAKAAETAGDEKKEDEDKPAESDGKVEAKVEEKKKEGK